MKVGLGGEISRELIRSKKQEEKRLPGSFNVVILTQRSRSILAFISPFAVMIAFVTVPRVTLINSRFEEG